MDGLDDQSEREIFLSAVDIKSESLRAQFVRAHCGNDSKQEQRIWALLSKVWTNQAEWTLFCSELTTNVTLNSGEEPIEAAELDFSEKTIGPYSVVKKIGEGGISEVFLAEQNHPVRRRVAIKLIKPGMETNSIIARFKQERHAMELLAHSGIAKLLDAGFSPMGRPFLAIEYIDGKPITEFCQLKHLDLTDRLRLFLKVCESVQYAHQNGILHRDLKPSNILIEMHGTDPEPKIIDFGIAKLLDSRSSNTKDRTQIGQLVGTLEYMSPEQASLGRSSVDIRCDVYALCCVLYELMTGKPPHADALAECDSVADALSVIQNDLIVRPLRCARYDSNNGAGTNLKWGIDLDWIVMKGLEKNVEARYATVHELMTDIDRYLRHDAVLARKHTLLYVATRFANRYRAAIAMLSVILLLGCIALGASAWGWRTAVLANEEATRHAEELSRGKQKIESTLAFFLSGVEKSKPMVESQGNLPDMTVEQLLTTYMEDLKKDIGAVPSRIDPNIAIEILVRLGDVALARYEPDPAMTAYQLLIRLHEQQQPRNLQKIFDAKFKLADAYFFANDYRKSEEILLSICPTSAPSQIESEAITMLARVYLNTDRILDAERVHKKIPDSIHSPRIDLVRGDILHRLGHNQQAFDLVSKVLNEVEGDPDMTARCTSFIGACLFAMERYQEGLEYYERLVAIEAGLYNKGHLASFDGRGQLLDAYIQCERYESAMEIAAQLKTDVENQSANSPIRRFLPMLRVRVAQCLTGLRRSQELLHLLDAEPIPESQLREREQFELNSYIAMALIMEGKREEASQFIQKAQAFIDAVRPEQFLRNISKDKVKALQEDLQVSFE
jgi:serine/threonine protein kinase